MSDVMIDICEYLISIGKLDRTMSMEEQMEFVYALPNKDQEYLLDRVVRNTHWCKDGDKDSSECKYSDNEVVSDG